jgi:hypothetical protein
MAMKIEVFNPEDAGIKVFRNFGVLQQHYTAPQPRRPWSMVLLVKLTVTQLVKKIPPFMRPDISLSRSR